MGNIPAEAVCRFEEFARSVMEDGEAAGLAVAVVNKEGETVYRLFEGFRDRDNKLLIDEDTIFGIASITKSFTTVSLMQLVQEGKVSLDSPVSGYIPEYKGFHDGRPVLVKHFLSHSGGYFPLFRRCIDPLAEDMGIKEEEVGDLAFYDPLTTEALHRVCAALDNEKSFNGLPGERHSYCNDGFALIGEIVHHLGGEPSFSDYVQKHVMEPLGMTRSSVDFVAPAKDPNAAVLYSKDEDTGEPHADHDYHRHAFVLCGGGGVKSTLKDMCRYVAMYLNDGRAADGTQILDGSLIAAMTTPRIWCGPHSMYGYGIQTHSLNGKEVWGHGGSLPGVSSQFLFCQETGLGVVVLCNTSGVSVGVIADAAMNMANGYDPVSPRPEYKLCPWTKEQKMKAAGEYSMEEGEAFSLKLNDDGELTMTVKDKIREIYPAEPDLLIVKGKWSDGFIRFYTNDSGEIFAAKYGSRIFPKKS